ncbi:hypothetical protein MVEN_00868700 [Mycena venus]|uniref:Uncharacterized protein n=1 Tax=Mycena venus TaxID=2733690 RepID=A0A8H6YFH0_9AGAR|nr:hypothetical protein MVEN_00868700 [Mycena venus]
MLRIPPVCSCANNDALRVWIPRSRRLPHQLATLPHFMIMLLSLELHGFLSTPSSPHRCINLTPMLLALRSPVSCQLHSAILTILSP